jgi:hypothetical protein
MPWGEGVGRKLGKSPIPDAMTVGCTVAGAVAQPAISRRHMAKGTKTRAVLIMVALLDAGCNRRPGAGALGRR